MLPGYTLSVYITAKNTLLSEEEFQELISPCLTYLHALKGAFDKKPCNYVISRDSLTKELSVRCVLMISLGRQRAEHLLELYRAIVRLIAFELPDGFDLQAESSQLNFS